MISFPISMFNYSRRVLFISSSKLAVYHWSKDMIGNSYLFDVNEDGFNFFGRYLDQVSNSTVYILLDTSAEEYRMDTIPHVFGSDRKAVITRKKDRLFRGATYFYTDVQGRQESGRRDDKVMFSAIIDDTVVRPWLEILEAHKVPVASIVSLPFLIQEIDSIFADMRTNALVFSLQSISGLRQSFFQDQALKFSRLVKMPRYGKESYAPIIADELVKIRRYIDSTHIIYENESLDIYLLGDKKLLQELKKTHVDSPALKYHFLDIVVVAEKAGMAEPVRTSFSDKYFAYQLLKYKSKNYYATKRETRYFQMLKINQGLRMASLIIALVAIIWTGFNMLESFSYKHQISMEQQKADFYSRRYDIAHATIPDLSVSPDDLKVIVDAQNVLRRYKPNPVDMFKFLSNSLSDFATIEIKQVQWFANPDPNYNLGDDKYNTDDTQSQSDFIEVGNLKTDYLYYHIALVKGHLKNFGGDYRKALQIVEQFAESLRQQDNVHDVSVITLPLDINSNVNLQGSTKDSTGRSDFSIRAVLGIKSEV